MAGNRMCRVIIIEVQGKGITAISKIDCQFLRICTAFHFPISLRIYIGICIGIRIGIHAKIRVSTAGKKSGRNDKYKCQ